MDPRMKNGATPMNGDEVLKRIFDHDFMDEMEVANKYLDYAVALDEEGKSCIAKKFAEMGYEEYTHAHVQREILIGQGYVLPQESAMIFEQLKHRIRTLFRR